MLPLLYFPTEILFLDDNWHFHEGLKLYLSDYSTAKLKFFSQDYELLDYLKFKRNYNFQAFEALDLSNPFEPKLGFKSTQTIYKELLNPDKSNIISTLVLDYSLQDENGIELARKLKNSVINSSNLSTTYIDIILLTGHADLTTAINAFNEGLITNYLRKQDLNFIDGLTTSMFNTQYNFFYKLSSTLLEAIKTIHSTSLLFSKEYENIILDYIKKNNIQEFYIFEEQGSFLFKNQDGDLSAVYVSDDIENKMLKEIASIEEVSIQEIEDTSKQLCFFDFNVGRSIPDSSVWSSHLKTSTFLEHEGKLYKYAFVDIDRT